MTVISTKNKRLTATAENFILDCKEKENRIVNAFALNYARQQDDWPGFAVSEEDVRKGNKRVQEIRDNITHIIEKQKQKFANLSDKDIKRINRYSIFKFNRESVDNFVHRPYEVIFAEIEGSPSASITNINDTSYYLVNLKDMDNKSDTLIEKGMAHEAGHTIIGRSGKAKMAENYIVFASNTLRSLAVFNWLLSLPGWLDDTVYGMSHGIAILGLHAPLVLKGLFSKHEENTCDKISDYIVPEVGFDTYINSVEELEKSALSTAAKEGQPILNAIGAVAQFTFNFTFGGTHPSSIIRGWRSNFRRQQVLKRRDNRIDPTPQPA